MKSARKNEVRVGTKVQYRAPRPLNGKSEWSKGAWVVSQLLPGGIQLASPAGGVYVANEDLATSVRCV